MTKPRISKVFDVSKYLSTKSGQELQDVLLFISELTNDFIACVSNGLSYSDNFDCEYKTVSIPNGTPTVISTKSNRRVSEIRVRQIVDNTYFISSGFGWQYNSQGQVVIVMTYSIVPPTNYFPQVNLVIYYS